MIPAKIYPCVIPANGSLPLTIEGDYFKIISAAGTFEVTGDSFGTLGAILPGQGLENTRFKRLTLRDTSGGSNTVQLLVAGEKFVDDRITGEVSVIDGEKARTLAGGMFSATPDQAATAGVISYVQLWNPGSSGKNLIVTAVELGTTAALAGAWAFNASALATDKTATTSGSKLSGAPAGVGQVRSQAVATLPLVPFRSCYLPAFVMTPWNIRGAIVVVPGRGLIGYVTTANSNVLANFEWFEENQ